ncbi:MAG: hypothetical protein LKJ17_00050 [Oscillospiraceae bacterium]|jgi:uncharacterized protein YdaT|nr:hypothetical protein [Oscillospiraceae bacterium]
MSFTDLTTKYQSEISDIKTLLSMTSDDTSNDIPIALSTDKAYKAILKYTEWDTFDTDYLTSLYDLAIAYFNNDSIKSKAAKGERMITQQTQGSRSATYQKSEISIDTDGLTDSIKAVLPLPKLKVI